MFGINKASIQSHQNYCTKKGFNFPILSDPGEEVTAKFKCQKPEGKGTLRTVYAVDTDGKVMYAERGQGDFEEILRIISDN